MGKGKGSFEYWACRYVLYFCQTYRLSCLINAILDLSAPPGRVIFEIGGEGLREEIARDGLFLNLLSAASVDFDFDFHHPSVPLALKIVSAVLPVRTDFITRAAPPRVGMMLLPTQTSTAAQNLSRLPTPSPLSS